MSAALSASASRDAPGRHDPDRHRATLLNVERHGSDLLASFVAQTIAVLLLAIVLFYLYRAVTHRRPEMPGFVVPLMVAAPLLFGAGAIGGQANLNHIADEFKASEPPVVSAASVKHARQAGQKLKGRARARADARYRVLRDHRRRQIRASDKRAEDKLDDRSPVVAGLGTAGGLALALSLVLVNINAMRVGLLSRFVGTVGVIVGVLLALPLLPPFILQIFWLGALGLLFLGRWPGGRGPAWETGEAIPWPTAAQRAQERMPEPAPAGEPQPQPEPEPERPARSSRKRRKKR